MSVQRGIISGEVLTAGSPTASVDLVTEIAQREGDDQPGGSVVTVYVVVTTQPITVEFLYSQDNGTTFIAVDGHLHRVWPGAGRGFTFIPIGSAVRVTVRRLAAFGDATITRAIVSLR